MAKRRVWRSDSIYRSRTDKAMAKRQKCKRTNNDLQNIHIKQDMTVTGCCYQKSPKRCRFFSPVFWQPFWKWPKFWRRILAPLKVTYHYVKFYASIIIHLEVININVRNFNFPIGFYSKFYIWTPQNITLIPFTTKLKTLGPTRNIYL